MASDPLVHVVDDDNAARDSLAFLLGTARFAVRTHDSARVFLDVISALDRGCIITDVRMPEIDGIELLHRLNTLKVDWPVIVITGQGDVSLAVEAMRRGAMDFIEKPYDDSVLLAAVRMAFSANDGNATRELEMREVQERMAILSPRERGVLDTLVAGRSNRLIANDLGISERAVEVHRANIMTKMQATTLSRLVRMVLISTQ
jgi:two-component system response regulator FixJ